MVYLVKHQKLGEYRIIKYISKNSDSVWKIREASILNRLKHPQIPQIYDIEEDQEAYYIIEEYVEGESLEALMLQSSLMTPDFIYQIIKEVANILDDLHHVKPNPIIYQDLKAEHVILSKGRVKLIDFGIASYLGEPENKVQNYGTPKFCAPEKRKEQIVTVQTDIYSIGKLLEELIKAAETDGFQNLMHLAEKAANADPSKRYASMKAFLEDLNKQMQSKNNSIYGERLLKKIVATGSQPRIGTTHLAISFTEYLNLQGVKTVYREKNSSHHMRTMIRKGGFSEEGGLYRRGNFLGMPAYGEGIEVNVPKGIVEILDYGTDFAKATSEKADLFLLVIGSKEWEAQQADGAYERLKNKENLSVVSNFGNRKQAKQYAGKYKQTIHCFPLDENPFFMTKEKERLFEGLLGRNLQKNKKRWYCGKRLRKWGNALVRGVSKLRGKRIG